MSTRDANGNSPTGNEYVSFYSSEQGANYKPQLIVNYTVPTWNENDWFYKDSAQSYGKIPKLKVNHTRAWHDLKNHAKWVLQWYNGYSWIDSSNFINNNLVSLVDDYTQKFALQFTPPYAGNYRLQLTVDYVLDSYNYDDASKTYSLLYHDFEGTNLTFTFGYSDISQLPGLGFSNYINPQGQFIFNITRTVSANEVNTLISLDPTYGIMPAAVTSSYEWDVSQVMHTDALRLGTSQYYLIAAMGDGNITAISNDGWLYVIKVWNDNGTIKKSLVDTWEYDNSYGGSPAICNVYGDIYALTYSDDGAFPRKLFTFKVWDTNGTIQKSKIDTLTISLTSNPGFHMSILNMGNNIFVHAGVQVTTRKIFLNTTYIDNNGNIGASVNDSILEAFATGYVDLTKIDSDTFIVASHRYTDLDGIMECYNVSSTGDITNTNASWWEFDNVRANSPDIINIDGNIYAIAYEDTNKDLQVKTLTIANTGMITKSWIDTLCPGADSVQLPYLFCVNDNGVYGVAYQCVDTDGKIATMNISASGTIGASVIDSLEFDTNDCQWVPTTIWVNKSYYLIVYPGADSVLSTNYDGWSCTVQIDTNYASPTFSNS
jgi:hypothetical protein